MNVDEIAALGALELIDRRLKRLAADRDFWKEEAANQKKLAKSLADRVASQAELLRDCGK